MKTAKVKKPGRIRASLLSWLGIPATLMDVGFWEQFAANQGVTSNAGKTVTQANILSLSAAWACTRLISETIATLPLSLYRRTTNGPVVATDHPLQNILHAQPNPDTTAAVHWESTVAAMLLRGNARAELLKVGNRIVGLKFLVPDRLQLRQLPNRQYEYRYTDDDGKQRVIPKDRIWTIPGFSLNGQSGCSVITYGANVFGNALAADEAAGKTFSKGLMPTTAFTYPTVMNPEQRADTRTAIESLSGSANAGKSAVLEAGIQAVKVGIDPNDAQLLESRGFSVEEVCRWFRTPPWMVGHGEKSTSWGTGIEQQMIGFLMFTLAPWLRRVEQSITKDLLTPAEQQRLYPKFTVEGLLRADSAGRATFYASMVDHGIFTRDEVRALEDREPMGGNAAVLTVQTAMAPLDSLGLVSDSEQARAALRGWLHFDDPQSADE